MWLKLLAIVLNDVADKNAYNKTTTDFIQTLSKLKPVAAQESRERKLENGIALKMARIVSMLKPRTIVYSTYNYNDFIPHSSDTK